MRRGAITILTLVGLLTALIVAVPVIAEVASPDALRPAINARYHGIDWVDRATLTRWMASPGDRQLLLLDVREPREYAVSHLDGARRVSPETTDMASLALPREAAIVVYCSVGYRSGAMAERLEAAGYQQVWNLQGGIFQWANEGRPLFHGTQTTELVHPYDADWGRMLLERHRSPL